MKTTIEIVNQYNENELSFSQKWYSEEEIKKLIQKYKEHNPNLFDDFEYELLK